MAEKREIKNAYRILFTHLKRRDVLESRIPTEMSFSKIYTFNP
jgi:hypothetical protein